jgi:probable HAF family extracellular repeat protein
MRIRTLVAALPLIALAFVGPPLTWAGPPAEYRVVDLGTLPGSPTSLASDVNNAGTVVGYQRTSDPLSHAWSLRRGEFTDLGTFGGTWSQARGINERGDIVGWATTADGRDGAFVWRSGVMANLGGFNSGSRALDINNRGTVVGYYRGGAYAVVWEGDVHTNLPSLGGAYAAARAINDRGQIVGYSAVASGQLHACLWDKGGVTDLGTAGGTYSQAWGINNRGWIVGEADVPAAPHGWTHAILWRNGAAIDIDDFSLGLSAAHDVNDRGQIVGEMAGRTSGQPRGFVWEAGVGTELHPLPGHERSTATAINERGDIVGWSLDQDTGVYRAVMWTR